MSQFSEAVPRVRKISQSTSYIPYGEVFVEESTAGWQSPYYFNSKELDEETGLYYYGARYLNPTEARWLSVDPLFEKYAGMSPYNYCAGNPVVMVDPDGRAGLNSVIEYVKGQLSSFKEQIPGYITSGADYLNGKYESAAKFCNENPETYEYGNKAIGYCRDVASMFVDVSNTDNLGWGDLTTIWLLELGDIDDKYTLNFGPNAITTKSLQHQEGVNNARNAMIQNIKSGSSENVNLGWTYGVKEFWDCIEELNGATAFLGSYNTKVSSSQNKDGSYTLSFEVSNTSSIESATRFRKDHDGNGVHDAIIPSRLRGSGGFNIGGNYKQIWKWTEVIKIED